MSAPFVKLQDSITALFDPLHRARGIKLRCKVCGRTGYPTNGRGWMAPCLRGHAPCPICAHLHPVNKDGTPSLCRGRGATKRHKKVGA